MLMARMIVPGAAAPGELPGEFTPVKVISSACYDKQQVCHSHARLVDSSGNRAL